MVQVHAVLIFSLIAGDTRVDVDMEFAKARRAVAAHLLVRIVEREDHSLDTGCGDGVDARRRAPLMSARLERNVQGRIASPLAGLLQRNGLRMIRAGAGMITASGDGPVSAHDERANHRVGTRIALTSGGQAQSGTHIPFVIHRIRLKVCGEALLVKARLTAGSCRVTCLRARHPASAGQRLVGPRGAAALRRMQGAWLVAVP